MKMFVVNLTYKKPLEEVDKFLSEHRIFLDKYYASKNIVVSGRKNPKIGGVILCRFDSLDEVNQMIKEDAYYKNDVANYEVIEFEASRGIQI